MMKWISIIKDSVLREEVENKLAEIVKVIENIKQAKSYGLLGGYGSVFLFLYYYYKYTQQEKYLSLLHKEFKHFYADFWQIRFGSFCDGYAGICWLIRFLTKEDVIETSDINDVLFDWDKAISYFMLHDIENKNWDFLHGALGMAYYYATIDNNIFESQINRFIEMLNHHKKINVDGSTKWQSKTYIDNKNVGMVYNLSLSHGMAALISFFVKLLKKTNNKLAFELLQQTIAFFRNSINPPNYISTFPKWFEQDKNTPSESPLSWCYGDPGIAQSLYHAGIFIKDKALSDLALQTLLKTTNRKDTKKEYIKEACFCHGSSSLCHIYNRLYQETHLTEFKETALYWLNDVLNKGKNNTALAGFVFWETPDETNGLNLLSGLSGIGLSLLAALDDCVPEWDECVLLS